MIKRTLLFCSILCLVLLSACAHRAEIIKSKHAIAQCVAVCKQRALACNLVCRNNCRVCKAYVACTAKKNYCKYVNEKKVEGGIVARELNSYKDPLKCRKTTCNCPADYQVCVQHCGGKIRKVLTVPPVCCEI